MKQHQMISQIQLTINGWNYLTNYIHYELWGKDDYRILWDKATSKIEMIYRKEQQVEKLA